MVAFLRLLKRIIRVQVKFMYLAYVHLNQHTAYSVHPSWTADFLS